MLRSKDIAALAAKQWARKISPVVALYLPFPVSVNRLYRRTSTGIAASDRYRIWKQAAGAEINRQRPGRIKGAFRCRIVLERKDGRSRIDADNGIKCLMDALQKNGVIENDKLAIEVNVSWSENVKGAHVTLTEAVSRVSSETEVRAA